MARYRLAELSRLIDHTNLGAYASSADIKKLCQEALDYGFCTVAINPAQVHLAVELLQDSAVGISACISFPLGQDYVFEKSEAARTALSHGATEIDYVCNLSYIKDGHWESVRDEMQAMSDACHEQGALVKVIFENCYLSKDEIVKLCEIASDVKPDFIKTSTGFGTGGATLEDVKLMRQHTTPEVQIKAAGGIRSADDFLAYVGLGASRIGCSAGISIIEELSQRMTQSNTDYLEI